ncbi:hypothetical protein VOLCADRAFT_82536 [Volvox carteri f. nagariensis]|uniref:Glycosyltransferase subfamily 4-like N-terminal domain-containing protein n=1 Tax=Volvox carteri f. nagariensis TaxID=3068 RepID=D8U5J8_VOLCA|nr:uncharacterized protein VOLCADRAFT_82536 [Volvox carteri f. nagariensis]EFJ45014.1 hypothetical protein VOLCADRAFT_82536 [Volvox carteri f. nagariensis]|eukprot:XP_002953985.1 hypothetical protein VOLCADRAFT_82536 [Volvox carteri f. nagariensis]
MNVIHHATAPDAASRPQRVGVLINVTGWAHTRAVRLAKVQTAVVPSTLVLGHLATCPRLRQRTRQVRTCSSQPTTPSYNLPEYGNGASTSSVSDPAASTWDTSQQPSTSGQQTRSPNAPRRVCIFVEPSPFTYVSGYKNRFTTMIKYLVEAGCEVLVVTTGKGFTLPSVDSSSFCDQPETFCGARVVSALSFGCPWYLQVPLSFALSPRIWREVRDFRPELIHCSSPGVMVFAAKFYAWLLKLPIVLSYHTHVPSYLPRYGIQCLVPAMWGFLRILHVTAHLTLTVSPAMVDELVANRAVNDRKQVQVWKKGVDSETFHPRFRSEAMRTRLTGGHPERPVIVYVGRLGFEKNLFFLRELLNRNPGVSLAFVGDGPARSELQATFKGTPTTFLGMLHGEDLSAAYASADIFVMPSESETLGFVVLEAMASELPVVAVRAGGIPDIICPEDSAGVTGFLYEPADVDKASELIGTLAANPELRARVGARARQEVAKWDWRAATMYLLNVQYPIAMAAAVAQYGKALGSVAQGFLDQQQQQLTPSPA